MPLSFEVKETDLLGRIGTLKVGGKTLETPYMFPVVHPVSQSVKADDLKSWGFSGLMTNAFIIHSRRKEAALQKGIHSLLGFDGIFMTDSGGYQVLEYGDLKLDYRQISGFQSNIGADLAVTLDRPTGYPQTREVAEETVSYSLKNAKSTLKEFKGSETVWVGPIQGGLFTDLVNKSTSAMVRAGFEVLALGSPVQVMENYMFAELVKMIVASRGAMPYSMPLHLFGAGHPLTMAMAVALGCDTFDSASYVLFARTGRYMTRSGILTLKLMKYLPCSCQVCAKTSVNELLSLDHGERTRLLSVHNLMILHEELELCKEAISEGRLWDLVEERSMAHPRLREAFIELVKHSAMLVPGTPAIKDKGLFVRSLEDLRRPELMAASKRLEGAFPRGRSGTLEPVPEGRPRQRKKSSGDRIFYRHPILGAYPAELRFAYPFSQTETSEFIPSSPSRDSVKKLKKLGYRRVSVRKVRNTRTRRASSPSLRSSSARSR